jgi:glutaredoxin 3
MSEEIPQLVMYSSPFCGYCAAAKRLLRGKGIEFTEINVLFNSERRAEMTARSGRTTVPQIFIGDTHLGGFDDINALDQTGRLDSLLVGSAQPD